MRIERIRNLIWTADIAIFLVMLLCFWVLHVSARAKLVYDRPTEWPTRGKTDPGAVKLRPPETFRDYETAILRFPMDGPKPPPEVAPDAGPAAGPSESELERIAELVSYRRFIPSTDEASVTLKMKTGGSDAILDVGDLVPGTVWMLVDVLENKAVFKHKDKPDAELQELSLVVPEVALPDGTYGPAPKEATTDQPGGEGPAPAVARREPEPVEIRPGVFQVTKEEETWFADEKHVEAVRQSIKVQPWKNPESGRYEGVKVSKVKPNSYLAKRGAKRNDILVSINGVPISSREGVINYMRGSGKGKKQYSVVFIRNGQRMTRTFTR